MYNKDGTMTQKYSTWTVNVEVFVGFFSAFLNVFRVLTLLSTFIRFALAEFFTGQRDSEWNCAKGQSSLPVGIAGVPHLPLAGYLTKW